MAGECTEYIEEGARDAGIKVTSRCICEKTGGLAGSALYFSPLYQSLLIPCPYPTPCHTHTKIDSAGYECPLTELFQAHNSGLIL